MSSGSGNAESDLRRLAEAAAWRVALFDAGADTSAEFEAWIADARNAEAWRQVQGIWRHLGAIEHGAALEQARASAARLRPAPRLAWRTAAAASVAALALGGVWAMARWPMERAQVYQTAVGQRRSIVLSDRSVVHMDGGTLLKVSLGGDERRLVLVRGQARFDVAHDTAHPFVVEAGRELVVATGTSFNVDLLGSKVFVTLIEGKVSIVKPAMGRMVQAPFSPPKVIAKLMAGDQFVAPTTLDERPGLANDAGLKKASIDKTQAWEGGQLVFDNEPLSSVAERVGRYTSRRISVDPAAGNIRLSGVFNAGDVAAFAESVERALPVVVLTDADNSVEIRSKR